jgi:hypothetical protein
LPKGFSVLKAVRGRSVTAALAALAAAAIAPATASGAELIARNANDIKLSVSADGKALVSYTRYGAHHRVLAWGAVNSIAPTTARKQLELRLDYSGGWKSFRLKPGRFQNRCAAYDGPALHWVVAACKAPDGSYWALQNWQRALPNYGVKPTPFQAQYELWLSHWKGPLPLFEVDLGWAYRRFHRVFGRFTYLGRAIYGFRTTSRGAPIDGFGRLVYVDTYNSAYGPGWKRENSFVTHKNSGVFCYGFYPHGPHPSGRSIRYRITVQGPGVMPDMYWEGVPPGTYDARYDLQQTAKLRSLGDHICR